MSDVLKLLKDADSVMLVLGIALLVLALLTPTSFFKIQIEWNNSKAMGLAALGLVLTFLSILPRFQPMPTPQKLPNISAAIDSSKALVEKGRSAAYSATTNTSDHRGCLSAAGISLPSLDEAIRQLGALSQQLKN